MLVLRKSSYFNIYPYRSGLCFSVLSLSISHLCIPIHLMLLNILYKQMRHLTQFRDAVICSQNTFPFVIVVYIFFYLKHLYSCHEVA